MLEMQSETGLSDKEAAYLAGSMFGAGSHTTASAIFFLMMAAGVFPEEARRVQDELDRVCGSRLPTFEDIDNLPNTVAFCKETFRWRPTIAGGVMHSATEDVTYGPYVIPRGTAIVGNIWSIHRDPKYYDNPNEFQINRWLTKDHDTGNVVVNKKLRHFLFGFGRRLCAGSSVAERSVYINCANLLSAFNITPKRDQDGKPILIDTMAFKDSLVTAPLPFTLDFTPRKADIRKLTEENADLHMTAK